MPSQDLLDMADLIRAMRESDSLPLDDVAGQRELMEAQQSIHSIPEDIVSEDFQIGDYRARMVRAPDVNQDAAVLYLHGGAYIMGSIDTHHELMARISRATHMQVLGIDYRLAPEHIYPAAVDDAVQAYDWLLSQGLRSEKVIIAGDSAGGGLAMAALLALKAQKKPLPVAAVLLSPWADMSGTGESRETCADTDPMISADAIEATASMYLGDQPADSAGVSPVFGDLSGLPPLLIQVGENEVLLSDSTRLHENAQTAGVESVLHVFPGAFHVFQAIPDLPESVQALAEIAVFSESILS